MALIPALVYSPKLRMIESIANAIGIQDYQTAQKLLQQIEQQDPHNPWIVFYAARLDEAAGNLEAAEQSYRQLLRDTANPKLIAQARQGLSRITEREASDRKRLLAEAKSQPGSQAVGVLILEPITTELKQAAAQKFAKIMQIDAYSARLQLPSRAWRLYRTGAIGELQVYTTSLRQAEIPCFCVPIHQIGQLSVYQVKYFESVEPQVTAVYQLKQGQQEPISFQWSEVSQRVEGLIPIFEECVDITVRHKFQRKTQTLDYLKFCDLHLPGRNAILRLWDQNYEFQQGVLFSSKQKATDGQTTTRDNWQSLLQFLEQQLPDIPVWSDFTPFAETAMDFQELLKLIEPHIDLLRREETPWDAAFQLYSGLAFARGT
jgi:hypothetical protein